MDPVHHAQIILLTWLAIVKLVKFVQIVQLVRQHLEIAHLVMQVFN